MDYNLVRKFSLEDDFMNYKTDDLVYGFMRSLSTARPTGEKTEKGKQEYEEYLLKKKFSKNKKIIANICGITPRAIDKRIEKLKSRGLIQEKTITTMIKKVETDMDCYVFPVDLEAKFQFLDKDVVEYLVNTRNSQSIRVFIYLFNKYLWKKETKEKYIFTLRELKEALGYAESTKTADTMIRNILASFKSEGILKYEKFYDSVDVGINDAKVVPVERMKLTYMVEKKADLPKF